MLRRIHHKLFVLRCLLARLVTGPLALGLLPVALLAAFRAGGQQALVIAAVLGPACLVLAGAFERRRSGDALALRAGETAIKGKSLEDALDAALRDTRRGGKTACLMLELENFDSIAQEQGAAAAASITDYVAQQLRAGLRWRDQVFFLGHGRFGVALAPIKELSPEDAMALSRRLQKKLMQSAARERPDHCFTTCIGIAISGTAGLDSGPDLMAAAAQALRDAREVAPATIRLHTPRASRRGGALRPLRLHDEALQALENGEIRAWFQPQLSTATGEVSGFEALARWCHPQRGVLSPDRFLPYLRRAGKSDRLQALMLREALLALTRWHAEGYDIPSIGVNCAPEDLRDPTLADNIAWELDRRDLAASRLTIEILETVVATSPDDDIVRNITRLSKLGCRIDLDDFGTGHASISSLKQFPIHRLKIDRSFVKDIDTDPSQQKMVAAILTMAEQLGLETLAEGVETAGQFACLADLGCGHVQGFGIARPLPFDETLAWLKKHRQALGPPSQKQRAGA